MTFVGLEWLIWMAGTTVAFWAAPPRVRFGVLAAITALFLWHLQPVSLVALAAMTLSTHLLTRGSAVDGRRAVVAVVPLLAILAVAKMMSVAAGDDLLSDTIIPIGLSYYTLRCVHFSIERFKGGIGETSLGDTIGYLFFLPTLFVGPIHRFPAWRRDRARHRWDGSLFAEGLERIVHGYAKVVFLGNYLLSGVAPDAVSHWAGDGPLGWYLEIVRIGLNLFVQFSGFSDIAIGFARLLGFRVMENFSWPLLARNISEFWSRWHISLTSWSRDYVYSSAIARTRSPAIGAVASMLAIALWHEFSTRYLLWGVYHGLGIVIWQRSRAIRAGVRWPSGRFASGLGRGASTALTVHFVFFGFFLVRTFEPSLVSLTVREVVPGETVAAEPPVVASSFDSGAP